MFCNCQINNDTFHIYFFYTYYSNEMTNWVTLLYTIIKLRTLKQFIVGFSGNVGKK